jgi:hypothetical protein
MDTLITRRALLQGSGALIVTFAMKPHSGNATSAGVTKPVDVNLVDSFLALGADGTVTVYSGKGATRRPGEAENLPHR